MAATSLYSYPSHSEVMSSLHHSQHELTSPGSPPELTNSKSSKSSSSFHSSSLSDTINHQLAHFEDVTLDDFGDQYMRNMAAADAQHAKPRPNSSARMTMPSANAGMGRDLTNKPNIGQQLRLQIAEQPQMTLGLPPKRSSRPRRPKPKPNSLLTNLSNGYNSKRSRSVSPISPHSLRGNASTGSLSAGPPQRPGFGASSHSRRGSWTPGRRKTVQELEDEYHDSDEDLPEDAVIWNVPISPRPPQEREKSKSPRQSWSAMPSPVDSKKGLGLDFSASANPLPAAKPPRSPRLSSLPRSVSMTSIPEDCSLNSRTGTKSWDATMSDLSAEARILTQVLEEHAEEKERAVEEKVQSGQSSPTRRSPKRTVSASTIELPPMRKGELMIDPLPVSKEKEKFLTRTRPSWLPPKDPEEEKRHLREYQKMMAKALEAEKKKEKKQQAEQSKRDDTKESLAKVWQENVLPNWDDKMKDPKTRELCWKGITPRDRGTVWSRAVGNGLGLTESSYILALERAKAASKRVDSLSEEEAEKDSEAKWFKAIRQDIREAFPELKIFQPEGPLHDTLIEVLMAYAMYRSDVGYVYGTHFIAALLILNLTGSAAFITLANLLNRSTPAAFLTSNAQATSAAHASSLRILEAKIPNLHGHLTNAQLELEPEEYLGPLYRSLFCCLGMDVASRILDVYVLEGDDVLPLAACAVLAKLEGKLYGGKQEVLDVLLGAKGYELGKDDDFMALVKQMGESGTGQDKRPHSW